MKTPKKKMHVSNCENTHDDLLHKPVKKNKRDRKISIYDTEDDEDDIVDDLDDDVYDDFDLDAFEESNLDEDY